MRSPKMMRAGTGNKFFFLYGLKKVYFKLSTLIVDLDSQKIFYLQSFSRIFIRKLVMLLDYTFLKISSNFSTETFLDFRALFCYFDCEVYEHYYICATALERF